MKILHLSDFHIGNGSLREDTPFPSVAEDYLYETKRYLQNSVDLPDLLIFTGDLVSKGETSQLNDPMILNFLNQFIEKKVPILLCNGNHDLKMDKIEEKGQFVDYTEFVQKLKKRFRIDLSKNFKKNQASFIDFPGENILFISLNSCHNIINSKEKKSQPATLPLKLTDEFFLELKNSIKDFNFRNKFVVIHHPIEQLKDHHNAINLLKRYNVNLIFSGHYHKFSKIKIENITGLTAGTIYGSNEKKWDALNLKMHPNQFNFYNINVLEKKVSIFQHTKNLETAEWEKNQKITLELDLRRTWNLSGWCNYLKINPVVKQLKDKKIQRIFEDTSKHSDFLGITTQNNIIKIFVLKRENQLKVNSIKSFIKNRFVKKEKKNLIIIDKTGKLKGQLPSEIIIECVNDDKT